METVNGGLNYNSLRAKKARFARKVTGPAIKASIIMLAAFLAVGGIALLAMGFIWGWLLVFLATPFIMLIAWISGELQDIPVQTNAPTIDGILDSRILGLLPKDCTPEQLARAAFKAPGGTFFGYRFGLLEGFFAIAATNDPTHLPVIWQQADMIRQQFGLPTISAPVIEAAIVMAAPQIDTGLAQYQLGTDDIIKGAHWYHHLRYVQTQLKRKKNDGGLGRDWSFGYTPLLTHFAQNVSDRVAYDGMIMRDIPAHQETIDRIVGLFSHGGRQNATLVGPLGSGKTTLVHAFAKRLIEGDNHLPRQLHYQQVFALDPSALISQAHGRGELEGLVQKLFYEAYTAKNIILFLDDAHLFFEDGTGSINLTNVLLPVLEGGALRIILAMDEQSWLRISRQNPALAQYINRVPVVPTDEENTMLIIEDQLILIEHRQKVTYMYQALQEAYRLSDRYIQDQSMPGKALMLLESAAHYATDNLVSPASVRQAIEQTVGVKVGTADDAGERETLLNMEDLIHRRMINQTRAVQVVSDALRRARAGVRNPDRPIGTFLFLGPTGVGKTELSKALAAVFFGGEDRLVRLDMNEYGQPADVSRLIADGATDLHSLTAQIARQPFSVVLLDEIEKAHPNVLNTLLQMLDEGILRDINNRQVSFRDAIIIATSNAGADRIRQYIEAGWQMKDFESRFTDELITSNQFRPEFLNRFDEIVLFRPLNQDELLQVIDLILNGINKTLAVQKVSVHVADDAKKLLVQAGYDPQMGARPMRRIVQRAVENIVAKRMLGGQVAPGQQVEITLQDVQAALSQEGR
ncbi:MAG TPA: ATP-dependent Clp protease ATP-binding subunit [Candidatus Saccharimonadales bacterium]|nr:ATP-dependent Clp protease ATP-binding subunit [Candidatus Saccharimonadales bacterium]